MVPSYLAMDSAPLETDSTKGSCRFVKESQSLPLDAFASYYGHRLPQCALIDEIGSEEGTTRGGDCASESSDTLSTGEYMLFSCITPSAPGDPINVMLLAGRDGVMHVSSSHGRRLKVQR